MDLLFTLTASLITCFVGAAITWQFLVQRHESELEQMDEDMTGELKQTLSTYCDLESRVVAILGAMRGKEAKFNQRLNNQRQNIVSLQEALSVHEAKFSAGEGTTQENDLERAFQAALEPISAAHEEDIVVDLPQGVDQLGILFEEFDRQSESISRAQLEAVEEQTEAIAELTARTREMEPLVESLTRRENELESWKRLHHELSAANKTQVRLLEQCIEGFKPAAEDLEGQEALVADWRKKLDEEQSTYRTRITELESQVQALKSSSTQLQEREQELSTARTSLRESEEACTEWKGKFEAKAKQHDLAGQEVGELRSSLEAKQGDLNTMSSAVDQRDGQIRDLESTVVAAHNEAEATVARVRSEEAAKVASLAGRVEELEPFQERAEQLDEQLMGAQKERDERASEVQTWQSKCEQAKSQHAQETENLQRTMKEVSTLKGQLTKGNSKLASSEETLESVSSELNEVSAKLLEAQGEAGKLHCELELVRDGQNKELEAARGEVSALTSDVQTAKRASTDQKTATQEQREQFERQVAELERQLESSTSDLATREQALRQTETDKDDLQQVLDQIEAAKADLEAELNQSSEKATSSEARVLELQTSLAAVNGQNDDQRRAMLAKMSSFQEAQGLLEAMRPMLEGLESTLREEGDGSSPE